MIRANINLEPLDRIAARHGFEAIREPMKHSTWESVHQFGQNILFFLLVLACNPHSARLKNFSRRRHRLLHPVCSTNAGYFAPDKYKGFDSDQAYFRPQPQGAFNLTMRLYAPKSDALTG